MVETVVQPWAVDRQGRWPCMTASLGVKRCANGSNGLVHGKGSSCGHCFAHESRICPLIQPGARVARAMENYSASLKVGYYQTPGRIFKHIRIELLSAPASGITGTPIVARYGIGVIRVRRKQVMVVSRVEGHRHHQLFAIIEAIGSLGFSPRVRERWQKEGGQDAQNSNHHKQLEQRESLQVLHDVLLAAGFAWNMHDFTELFGPKAPDNKAEHCIKDHAFQPQ